MPAQPTLLMFPTTPSPKLLREASDEINADTASRKLKESFACGPAAIIAGSGTVKFTGGYPR